MMVFWVVMIVGIVWVGARLLPRSGPTDQPSATAEQPRQILERRLAKGEIDVETYDALREKLRLTH
jgi:putative membrane protein